MKILHINTYDMRGGAARAAYRLHTGLRQIGHESTLWVAHRSSDDPSVKRFLPPLDFPHRVRRLWRRKAIARELGRYQQSRVPGGVFTSDRSEHHADVLAQLPQADIINLHWIATFIDYTQFFGPIVQRTPLVWTLHDMSAFTGGCHIHQGCGKFTLQCGACPILGSSVEHDLSRQIWQRKQAIFARIPTERLHIVTPSHALAHEVKRSTLLNRFPLTVIPHGLNTAVFTPHNQRFSRDILGISQDVPVVLFGAIKSTSDPNEGFNHLVDALKFLAGQQANIEVMVLGANQPDNAPDFGLKVHYLGYLNDTPSLVLAYNAADVFVLPSQQESFGQMVVEAMACGVPVVAFDTSALPELIEHQHNGYLTQPFSSEDFANGITWTIANREMLSANARQTVLNKFELTQMARHYAVCYEQIRKDYR